jgi:hypothetical protein
MLSIDVYNSRSWIISDKFNRTKEMELYEIKQGYYPKNKNKKTKAAVIGLLFRPLEPSFNTPEPFQGRLRPNDFEQCVSDKPVYDRTHAQCHDIHWSVFVQVIQLHNLLTGVDGTLAV